MARGGTSPALAFGSADAGRRLAPVQRSAPCESWTLTAEQVERWLKGARIGEQLVYAHGPSLIDGAAAALVRRLGGDNVVHPFPRRHDDGGFDYVARLLRARVVSSRAPVCDPMMMAVLVELQAAAEDGRRCPSDAEIADSTSFTADQVKWQLKKLEEARFIARRTVRSPSEPKYRVVRIVATGCETALPAPLSAAPSNPTGGRK